MNEGIILYKLHTYKIVSECVCIGEAYVRLNLLLISFVAAAVVVVFLLDASSNFSYGKICIACT